MQHRLERVEAARLAGLAGERGEAGVDGRGDLGALAEQSLEAPLDDVLFARALLALASGGVLDSPCR